MTPHLNPELFVYYYGLSKSRLCEEIENCERRLDNHTTEVPYWLWFELEMLKRIYDWKANPARIAIDLMDPNQDIREIAEKVLKNSVDSTTDP